MNATASILSVIQQRYSCRNYAITPLNIDTQQTIQDYLRLLPAGPFQKSSRFELVAASDQDRSALRGLGTYGFIKNPPAFIIGTSEEGPFTLEDFGYRMEQIILQLTRLNLGTCWLGGTFTRSAFAHKIAAGRHEILPAVCSLGYPSQEDPHADTFGKQPVISRDRLAWEELFFDERLGNSLAHESSGAYTKALEMVRLAPSASNKQPWRILRQGRNWHFYLQRTKGYREIALGRFTGIADMQRIDMGIAMCHFELGAKGSGLSGKWVMDQPEAAQLDVLTSYVVTWKSE
jgi:nitroreductase